MTPISTGDPVSADEELRRAVDPEQLDPETQMPTSAAFRPPNVSLDVGSLATLAESRARFPSKYIAITMCQWFLDVGRQPIHDPEPNNVSHAIVPGRLNDRARKIAVRVRLLHPPINGTSPGS